jgi:UDP-glucose 4-epimerase
MDVYIIDNLSLGKDHWIGNEKRPTLFVENVLDFKRCDEIFNQVVPEVVIHLAAHHYIPFCEKNIFEAFDLNVKGTLNILECASKQKVSKFFFASTGDVYPPSFVPHREVDMVSPIYVYGQTKLLGEQICIKYFETKMSGSSLVIGRLFNATGLRETNPHLLPDVVKQIVDGKRRIEVGNTWPQRDFVDVSSMAMAIADLTELVSGIEIVNIGSGNVQGIGEALETLTAVLPFDIEIVSVKERQRPNDRPFLCPDTSRLKRILGRSVDSFRKDTAKKIFSEKGLL